MGRDGDVHYVHIWSIDPLIFSQFNGTISTRPKLECSSINVSDKNMIVADHASDDASDIKKARFAGIRASGTICLFKYKRTLY